MNSDDSERRKLYLFQRWKTADGSPWWLRNSVYNYEDDEGNSVTQPSGDYFANCYMNLGYSETMDAGATAVVKADSLTFDDNNCQYHSKAYYCQSISLDLTAKDGSPEGCQCKKVEVTGSFHTPDDVLIKCENCLDVYRSEQKNSCPYGTKIFSPESRADWKTFLLSAMAVRAPHWIIDVTRPQSGGGNMKEYPMNSNQAEVATWGTSDHSAWFLRDTVHVPAHDDYKANCFLNVFAFDGEDSVIFDAGTPTEDHPVEMGGSCWIHSSAYFCQYERTTTTTTTTEQPTYFKIDAHEENCEDHGGTPIHDETECEEAAHELGLADMTVSEADTADRPEGCSFWIDADLDDGQDGLLMNTNHDNVNTGTVHGVHQICSRAALWYQFYNGETEA